MCSQRTLTISAFLKHVKSSSIKSFEQTFIDHKRNKILEVSLNYISKILYVGYFFHIRSYKIF